MAYIGTNPANTGTGLFSQDTFTGDGSTVTFDLTNVAPDGGGNELQVFVDNVRQQEGSSNAYTLGQDGSGDLKRITFTSAPAASASIFVLNPGTKNVQQLSVVGDNTVTAAKLQSNAITTAKITDANVTTAKIAADAINATKIADDAISEEHLDVTAITGNTELSAVAADDDVLLVYDTSSGNIKKIQRSNIALQSPTVSSISPSNVNTGDGTGNHTIVVTGTKFDSAPTASFINASGVSIASSSTTRNSATQLTVVVAKSSLPDSGEPYDIKVLNNNGLAATLDNALNINAQPVFVTSAGTLGTVSGGASVDVSVNATDPESAGNVTFEIQSGSLPAGLTLTNTAAEGGTAKITGTATNPVANTTSNFVLRAVDAASNTTSRAFSITVNRTFSQTSFTSSGTFAVPSGTSSLDAVLVVAGGGGGGTDHGGGGGAGGLVFMPGYPVTPGGTITVTVGCGGISGQNSDPAPFPGGGGKDGRSGQDSVFGAPGDPGKHPSGDVLTAKAGGGGGGGPVSQTDATEKITGQAGGSAGGAGGHAAGPGSSRPAYGATQPTQPGDSGAYGFGGGGGTAHYSATGLYSGGGGGAGAGGKPGVSPSGTEGQGGIGKAYTIADGTSPVYYAGGGGGTHYCGGACTPGKGQGGQGGGGSSVSNNPAPTGSGTANRGGGAGGGSTSPTGGKGIVIVRY
jgi:hypothetical protein